MPEEIEIETKDLQETIDELREEREERERLARETRWTRFISLSTAIFAVFAALAAMQAGRLVNDAVLQKNDAVLQQSRASDAWAYYQAKGIKAAIASQTEAIMEASTGKEALAKKWHEEAARQKASQEKLKAEAEKLEEKRDEKDAEASDLLHKHEIFAQSVTCLQVAISLSAIAALTKRKDVWIGSILVGALGAVLFMLGFLHLASKVEHLAGAHAAAESSSEVQASSHTANKEPAETKSQKNENNNK